MRPILSVLCLLLCLVARPASALDPARGVDEYAVRGWSMADGLPHNLIQAIAQDDDGLLWLGTWEGLAVFNGREYSPPPVELPDEIDARGIGALLRDRDGAMLVGTVHAGVLRFADGRWQRLGGEAGSRLAVYALAHGHDGDLWIGTREAFFRLDRDGRLHPVGDGGGRAGGMSSVAHAQRDGGVLLGSSRGLFRWTAADGLQPYGQALGLPPERSVRAIVEVGDALWIAGDDGAWRYRGGALERVVHPPAEALLVDRDGQVWVALSAGGLVRHTGSGALDRMGERNGLVGRSSRALFEDREGLLWAGTTGGLYRIVDGPVSSIGIGAGLGDNYVRSLLQTGDGSVWIAHAGGLDHLRDGRPSPVWLGEAGVPMSPVMALAPAVDGGIWAGSYARGLFRVRPAADDGGAPRVERVGDAPRGQIRALQQQPDGVLWMGGSFGLMRFHDGQWTRFGIEDGLPGRFVQSLMLEPDGTLWIGTSEGMARRSPDGRFATWPGGGRFPAYTAFDFLRDADGSLWIASDRGLLRMRGDAFARYGTRAGFPREVLFRVLDDGRGSLWLSSNDGLFRVARSALDRHDADPARRLPVEVFDREDGMPDSQANGGSHPAGWRTRDGRLWFPTVRGVAVVDPDAAERQRAHPVGMIVQSVQVDGVERGGAAPVLDAGGRRIRIRYAGMNLRGAEKLRYRYRMVGFDAGWIEAGTAMEAVYTNLPPGRLRFEVQGMRMPVDWEGAPARVDEAALIFDSPLPWWRQPAWMALAAGGAVLLVWMLHALATLQQRRSRRRLQLRIDAATRELRGQHDALAAATREREALLARLAHQARHDALTGLPNRRAGDEFMDQALARAAAEGGPLSVALFDLDHFKRINDAFGHGVGDDVLRSVGALAADALGADAFLGRHGGEEFLVCLPGVGLDAARARLEALCRRVAGTAFAHGEGDVRCTLSAGVAAWRPGDGAAPLLARADAMLYRAKASGRDRVMAG